MDDAALLACALRARDGDREALEELLGALRPGVFRYCQARIGQRELAQDVTQEVCMALVAALPRFRDEGRPFAAFAYGIASRQVAQAYRVAGRRRETTVDVVPEVTDGGVGPEGATMQAESAAEARRMLDTLPEAQREILLLRVAAGLSAEETAAVLGSTPGAVRVAQHRALTKLRLLAASPGTDPVSGRDTDRGPDEVRHG